jgi:hypothetical protein
MKIMGLRDSVFWWVNTAGFWCDMFIYLIWIHSC